MRNFILTTAAGITLLLGIVGSTPLMSYVSTGWDKVKNVVSRRVPIDFELDRARKLLVGTESDVRNNYEMIAKQEKELVRLEEKIAGISQRTDEYGAELRQMKESGATNGQMVVKFTSLKRNNSMLENLSNLKEAKTNNLAALKAKHEEMVGAREQLKVEIENLEARWNLAQANKETNIELDTSNLNAVRELVDSLDVRIAAEEQMSETDIPAVINSEEMPSASIEEVEAFLASDQK